jgi:hypothetical protein
MTKAAHSHGILGKTCPILPLTHLKDRYYHEVAAMPKIIRDRMRPDDFGKIDGGYQTRYPSNSQAIVIGEVQWLAASARL